jgi:putative addiction module component (TIGR02574 family)
MSTVNDLANVARSLEPKERLWLIEQIWDSLPPDQWPAPSDGELAEVKRRSSEYDAGRTAAAPWEEVRDRLSRRISSDE